MKKRILRIFTVFLSLFLFAATFSNFAFASEATNEVQFKHVNIEQISDKTLIQTGNPSQKYGLAQNEVLLVYKQVAVEKPAPKTEKPTPPTDVQAQNKKVKKNVDTANIPMTGYVICFVVLAGGFIYLVHTKKYKQLFVIALFVVGGATVVNATTYNELVPTVTKNVAKDVEYAHTPIQIEGYEYVGYISNTIEIEVSYVDEASSNVLAKKSYFGKRGDQYRIDAIEIEGFTPAKLSIAASGTYTKNLKATYTYKKEAYTMNLKFIADRSMPSPFDELSRTNISPEDFYNGAFRTFDFSANVNAYNPDDYRYYLLSINDDNNVTGFREIYIGETVFNDQLNVSIKKGESYSVPRKYKIIALFKTENEGQYDLSMGNINGDMGYSIPYAVLRKEIPSIGTYTGSIDFIYDFYYEWVM